ncbi:MAG: phosphate ABC transporter permease PstA [Firmicutes bacterium]|nr:phosphate ABC transporter permease PstA [Bacillota bacterium]
MKSADTVTKKRRRITRYTLLKWAGYACAGLAIAALAGILLFVLIRGLPHLSFHFLFGKYSSANPSVSTALVGTLMLVFLALIIGGPIGIMAAVFLTEYAKKGKFVNIIRLAVETLAAIPSIVYGLFGMLVFGVLFGWGHSFMGAGLTLSIMILPVIIRSTEESLLAVPQSYREGAMALGAGRVRTIFRVVLPNAAGGIVSGLILAVGRIISESAALILTLGLVVRNMPTGFMSPGTSLALNVYFFGLVSPEAAAATSVVLVILVVGLNLLAMGLGRLLSKNKGSKKKRPARTIPMLKSGVEK